MTNKSLIAWKCWLDQETGTTRHPSYSNLVSKIFVRIISNNSIIRKNANSRDAMLFRKGYEYALKELKADERPKMYKLFD